MELHEIRYFLALSRMRNFTRAAESCNVTQPALTRAIQKLEQEMGGPLFSRERGRIRPTGLGQALEPHLTEILTRADAAKHTARRFQQPDHGGLTLGVMGSIGPLWFARFLGAFRRAHPGIETTLVEDTPGRLSRLLVAGAIDSAVMAQPDGFAAPLSAESLYSERFTVACAVGHPFQARDAVAMRELDGQPYLLRTNCEFRDVLGERVRAAGARLVERFRSEREDWLLKLAAAGLGICLLPEFSAVQPGLVARPVVSPSVFREVCLVTVSGRRASAPLERFVRDVRDHDWWRGGGVAEPAANGSGGAGRAAAQQERP